MRALLIASSVSPINPRFAALQQAFDSNFPGSWQCMQSIFLVSTLISAVEMRDLIKPLLHEDDELLVAELAKSGWAWRGMSREGFDWLRKHA